MSRNFIFYEPLLSKVRARDLIKVFVYGTKLSPILKYVRKIIGTCINSFVFFLKPDVPGFCPAYGLVCTISAIFANVKTLKRPESESKSVPKAFPKPESESLIKFSFCLAAAVCGSTRWQY
jgi:hypothetical protein